MALPRHIDRRTVSQQVADDIEEAILDKTYPADSRLPSEQQLASQYGVSRSTIREALKRLQEHGLIVIKNGRGAYVCTATTRPVSDALRRFLQRSGDKLAIAHFYEVRRMIELESVRLAAQRADEQDLQAIEAAFHTMVEEQGDSAAWSQADLQFHLAIATAAHNPLLPTLLAPLIGPLRDAIAAGHADPAGPAAGLEAHERIIQALRERDPDAAYRAMVDHLLDSEQRLCQSEVRLSSSSLET